MSFIDDIRQHIKTLIKFLTVDIWHRDFSQLGKTKSRLIRHLRISIITIRHFGKRRTGREAVALSFFSTMATIPMLSVILIIANRFGFDTMITKAIHNWLSGNTALTDMALDWAGNIIKMTKSGPFGWITFLTFVWIVIWMMICVEDSFNHVWKVKKSRKLFHKISISIAIMLLAPFVVLMFIYGFSYYTSFIGILGDSKFVAFITSKLYWVVLYVAAVLIMSAMYKFIPHATVNYSSCLKASLLSAIVFVAIQYLYLETQIMVTRLNAVYGVIAAIPLYMVWLNFCWFSILYGADLSYAFEHVDDYNPLLDSKA